MKEIRLVLFDLDDTLLHFDDYWTPSMRESFQTYPLTKSIELDRLFPVFLKKDEQYHEQWLDGTIDGTEFRRLRFIHTLSEFDIAAGAEEAESFERWYWSVRAPYIPFDRDLVERLQRLSRRYMLGIVSNGTAEDQLNKLNRMGLDLLFTEANVFVSERMGEAKPRAGAYLLPASHFGVAPSQTLFVGDSWMNDVAGPIAAGMKAVWMNRKGLPVPPQPQAIDVIQHLSELESMLLDE
jgi:putative hydrolase of the HAD superfamily